MQEPDPHPHQKWKAGSGFASKWCGSATLLIRVQKTVPLTVVFFSFEDSAWVFIGGLPYELTEGDVICVFSQYGEVVHINLIRDHTTGKSRVSEASKDPNFLQGSKILVCFFSLSHVPYLRYD
jgi:hypothetical protein